MPERASCDPPHRPARRAPLEVVLGLACVLVGALVPSAVWIDALRETPPELWGDLMLGTALSRAGLVLLGFFTLAGWRLGWWRSYGEGSVEPVELGRGDNALLAILAVAIGLRLYCLGEGLWLDEILALVDYYRRPLGEILTTFHSENQHFATSILAHVSSAVFGESAWAIRLPAALFGVASIWALYVFARHVAGRREALLSCALLAVSYHHVWFSQNARGYTAVLFFTLLASWLFLRALSERRPRLWGWYAAAVALGMYSHLTMAFVVLAHLTLYSWALVARRGENWPRRWSPFVCGFTLSGLLVLTLYGVGIPQFVNSALAEKSVISAWKNPLWTLRETLSGLSLGGGRGIVAFAGSAILGIGIASYARTRPAVVVLLFLPAAITAGAALLLGHHLWPRSFFVVAGFGILVTVRGLVVAAGSAGGLFRLGSVGRARLGNAAVVIVICVSAATLTAAFRPKQDFEGARDFVLQASEPGDTVVVVGLATFPYRTLFAPEWANAASAEELNGLRAQGTRTWVLHSFPTHMTTIHPDIMALLERDFRLVRRFDGSLREGQILVHRADDSSE